ncbi:MAG: glycine betaine ABC transporter substrate-binding protein [Eubacteriales bacterium]
MLKTVKKCIAGAIVLSLLLVTQSGCAAKGETIKVGSKEFTEQLLLGQITILALQSAGYNVEDVTGVAGSNKNRTALLDKDIDIYWEYTGTAWLSLLQHENAISDSQECYDKVKAEDAANGIDWLQYAPLNNTYTIMMRSAQAQDLGIKTLSDLGAYIAANPSKLLFAVDHEFTARPDGLPGLEEKYKFAISEDNIVVMDNAIIYKALKESQADIGMGFSTDGRIQAFGLMNIEDDLGFFPAYNPAPNLRVDFAKDHPEIVALLNKISAKLDTATIMQLNYQVDIEQKEPAAVAKAWLKAEGLI